MTRLTYTTLSPLKRRVTIRKHPFKGYEVVRGGVDLLSDEPIHNLEEAERFAKMYCDYWGDEYGGLENDTKNGAKQCVK